MKQRYINPFTDFGFKKLFGEESNKNVLIDFLNSLLPTKHRISNLEYTKNEAAGQTLFDRRAVFDISCVGENGERFIVELQKAKQNFFKDRSVFYATFPIREQAERGDTWNFELAAVYCVGILDFVFDEDRENAEYLHVVQLKNQANEVFYDKLTFVYVEMPKFTKSEAELVTQSDKWLYFIKHVSHLSAIPEVLQEQIFEEAFQTAEIAQFSPAQAAAYESSLKYYRDMQNVVNTAMEEAATKARAEGKAEGRAEGKLESALVMVRLGMPIEEVSRALGIAAEVIDAALQRRR
jgi:predicted transposase/invertase (TIGR01784 family)